MLRVGDMNLSDALTKNTLEAHQVMALYHTHKTWVIRFDQEFVSARKQQKLPHQKQQEEAKMFEGFYGHVSVS